MSKTKKIISYIASGIIGLLFVAMFASPEISSYFKNRGLPSESDLKGNTKFPYSMNYAYLTAPTHLDEKLYLYSQGQEDWILVSETKRTFNNQKLDEVSDWNVITP